MREREEAGIRCGGEEEEVEMDMFSYFLILLVIVNNYFVRFFSSSANIFTK